MRYALVTGATSGIGIALSRVLVRKGYGIIMVFFFYKKTWIRRGKAWNRDFLSLGYIL